MLTVDLKLHSGGSWLKPTNLQQGGLLKAKWPTVRWLKKVPVTGVAAGGDGTHQVEVPWLSRVAFQSLLPQALNQQRDHSMVAGDEGGDRRRRRGGDGERKRGREQGGEGERKRRRRRREGRATPVCASVRLVRRSRRWGKGLRLLLLLTASGPGSPAHSHKDIVSEMLPQGNTPGGQEDTHKHAESHFN